MAENDVGLAVFDHQRSIEAYPVLRSHRTVGNGAKFSVGSIRTENPCPARVQSTDIHSIGHGFYITYAILLGDGDKKVVLTIVLMNFRRPDRSTLHPGGNRKHPLLLRPRLEIAARAHEHSVAAAPGLGFIKIINPAFGHDERISDLEITALDSRSSQCAQGEQS